MKKRCAWVGLWLASMSVSQASYAQHSPSQHLEAVRTAALYALSAPGVALDRAGAVLAFQALKGTLTIKTITLAADSATAAGQLYFAALACHAGDRRAGETLLARLDERTAILSAVGGTLVYRSVRTLLAADSPHHPCPTL